MRWRKLSRAERRTAFAWGAIAATAILLRPLWSAAAGLLPPCLMREITGLPCPTCGATRAGVRLLQGHGLEALVLNPLVTVGAVGFLGGALLAAAWVACGGRVPVPSERLPGRLLLLAGALVVANWIYLLARGV